MLEQMKKYNGYQKRISLFTALVLALFATAAILEKREMRMEARMQETQENLAKEVFRFHVLANSDSEEDQALKLSVKEGIISYMKEELPDSGSAGETKEWARAHVTELETEAERIVRQQGYDYEVRAEVAASYFPDKTYGDVTFPKGRYEALRMEIGKGEGRNWWCVLYPNLCFVDATHAVVPEEGKEELEQVLTEDEYDMVTATSKFKIKCFFLEK